MNKFIQEQYEIWAENWKPGNGENHPVLSEVFEAGWLSAIEAMLNKLETAK
jgi:hypothetical protein